tara:strand:- start:187 stop:537 length:351 start_codon:yes stop_codon:yes gene_type:complete
MAQGIDAAAAAITAHFTPVPASSAYAQLWGIATQAVETPAIMSVTTVLFSGAASAVAAAAAAADTPAKRRAFRPTDGPRRSASTPGPQDDWLRLIRAIFVRPTGTVAATRADRAEA